MKKKTLLFIVTALLIPVVTSCNNSSPTQPTAATMVEEEYLNPIDKYFLPKIEKATSEVERRGYQDSYRGVWKEEFYNILQWLDNKCEYQEDKENLISLNKSVDNLINECFQVITIEQFDFYSVKPGERYITGNAYRSSWNQTQGEIFRDVCIRLITDDYNFLERDYSQAIFE